jgi:4a-hydroxytetrahydrobiopterin dehydratase
MEAALAPLLKSNGGQWVLGADGEALERTFKFKTFAKTWVSSTTPSLIHSSIHPTQFSYHHPPGVFVHPYTPILSKHVHTYSRTLSLTLIITHPPSQDFMTAVSLQCKLKNHHPEWSNVFNTTFIRWTTHQPKGLSAKDVELAAVCDALARDFGELVVEGVAAVEKEQAQARQSADHQPSSQGQAQGGSQACDMSGLAGRAASSVVDCCVPRKK